MAGPPPRPSAYTWEIIRGITPRRKRLESDLARAGSPLTLPQQAISVTLAPLNESCLLILRAYNGEPSSAVGLQLVPSGIFPGHRIARVERFGPGLDRAAVEATLRALVDFGKFERRILRVHVESFFLNPNDREAFVSLASGLGFVRSNPSRCYERTLLVDLRPGEDTIFANLHATARRHIRSISKHPAMIRPITDAAVFDRMDQLYAETFKRTGASAECQNWAAIVRLCQQAPHASRIVGLFRTDRDGPEALLAFAWACAHGDHAHYAAAASARDSSLAIPLMYPIVWDLISWAKSEGVQYFDFGGVTAGTHESGDPLGGISDFKRYFSRDVVEVGGEWVYEARPLRSRMSTLLSHTGRRILRHLEGATRRSAFRSAGASRDRMR